MIESTGEGSTASEHASSYTFWENTIPMSFACIIDIQLYQFDVEDSISIHNAYIYIDYMYREGVSLSFM